LRNSINKSDGTVTLGAAAVAGPLGNPASIINLGANELVFVGAGADCVTVLAGKVVGTGGTNGTITLGSYGAGDGTTLRFAAAGNAFDYLNITGNGANKVVIEQGADVTAKRMTLGRGMTFEINGKFTVDSFVENDGIGAVVTVGAGAVIDVTNGAFHYNANADSTRLDLGTGAAVSVTNGDFYTNRGLIMRSGSSVKVKNGDFRYDGNLLTMESGASITVTGTGNRAELKGAVTVGAGSKLTAPVIRLTAATTLNLAGDSTWSGAFELNNNLTVNGTAKQVFNGEGSGTGTVTVNGGTLVINADFTDATGKVTVAGGGTLGGKGQIGGATEITGSLNADGMTFKAGLTLKDGATWNLTSNDGITVNGLLDIQGEITFNFLNPAAGTWVKTEAPVGDSATFVVTSDASFDPFDPSYSAKWNIVGAPEGMFDDLDKTGNRWYFAGWQFIPIPEPSTWALLGAGAAFVTIFRRRRAN